MMDALSLLPEHRHARFDSRHRLVLAASQRAKHLLQGGKPLGMSKFTKDTTIALDEVLQGLIEFLAGKEARQAMKDAKRGRKVKWNGWRWRRPARMPAKSRKN